MKRIHCKHFAKENTYRKQRELWLHSLLYMYRRSARRSQLRRYARNALQYHNMKRKKARSKSDRPRWLQSRSRPNGREQSDASAFCQSAYNTFYRDLTSWVTSTSFIAVRNSGLLVDNRKMVPVGWEEEVFSAFDLPVFSKNSEPEWTMQYLG